MDEHVGSGRQPPCIRREPDVAAKLLHVALQGRVLERCEIEGAHRMPVGDEASGEMQAEKARAAGDRDEHGSES